MVVGNRIKFRRTCGGSQCRLDTRVYNKGLTHFWNKRRGRNIEEGTTEIQPGFGSHNETFHKVEDYNLFKFLNLGSFNQSSSSTS